MFYHSLFEEGIITLENLLTDTNISLVKQNPNVLPFTPLEWFQLIQILEALPTQWRTPLASCGPISGKTFILNDQIELFPKNQAV